jgi:hypothetical protein
VFRRKARFSRRAEATRALAANDLRVRTGNMNDYRLDDCGAEPETTLT